MKVIYEIIEKQNLKTDLELEKIITQKIYKILCEKIQEDREDK